MSGRFNFSHPYTEITVKPFPSSARTITIVRPILPTTLFYGKKLASFQALIDSGADSNVFHGDIAVYLGIKLSSGSKKSITGIGGGKIKTYEHNIHLMVGRHKYKTTAMFSNQIPDNALAVLGNKGFFSEFLVELDYKNKLIILSR